MVTEIQFVIGFIFFIYFAYVLISVGIKAWRVLTKAPNNALNQLELGDERGNQVADIHPLSESQILRLSYITAICHSDKFKKP